MRRNFLLALVALLAVIVLAAVLVTNASPVQGSAPATPKATRNPIKQATRRATRGLPKKATATAAPTDTPQPRPRKAKRPLPELQPSDPGPMSSTILVFNPDTSGSATVQIDVYNAAGAVAYTTTTTISANGMKLINLPGSLGTNYQGGAQVSSDKNVQAVVLGANANNTARDTYEGIISPALDVTLPFVRHLQQNTQNTMIAIQNTGANDGSMTLKLYDVSGMAVATQTLSIAPHQSRYFNTNTLFPGGTFLGSARIVSDQNIAVAAQALYYVDTASIGGVPSSSGTGSVYLNQAERKINGSNVPVNWSEIFVRNNGASPTNITADFYASTGGAPITSTTANNVAPNGLARFLLNDPSFASLGTNFIGWAHISSNTSEPLVAAALDAQNKGKRLFGLNGFGESTIATRYVCGDIARMGTENSQVMILNPDATTTAVVVVRLYDPASGGKVAQAKYKVPPLTRSTILLSDVKFAAAGNNYEGMALVQVNGATPPKVAVTVNNPYMDPKAIGTSGYSCSAPGG